MYAGIRNIAAKTRLAAQATKALLAFHLRKDSDSLGDSAVKGRVIRELATQNQSQAQAIHPAHVTPHAHAHAHARAHAPARGKVHILTCETRSTRSNGTRSRDLGRRTQQILGDDFVVKELCSDLHVGFTGTGFPKVRGLRKLVGYAQSVPPHELLIVSDSDVLFNGFRATGDEVHARFDRARGSALIVFQAEPFCWAPTRKRTANGQLTTKDQLPCDTDGLVAYEARGVANLPWRCPRFLNAGAYAARAADLLPLALKWSKPQLWKARCLNRLRYAVSDQCIATWIYLQGNASIALDSHEELFATGGMAVEAARPCPGNMTHCRHRNFRTKIRPNASSAYSVPCGRMQCDTSLRFADMWRVDSMELQRPPHYKEECQITTAAPFLVHFNGDAKRVVKERQLQSWLDSAHPLHPPS